MSEQRRATLGLTGYVDEVQTATRKKKRKVAGRAAAEPAQTGVENAVKVEDPLIAAQMAAHKIQDEMGIPHSGQAERMMAGIELPSLATKILFGNDTLLLGRNLMLIGEEGSCKSAFLAEIIRWVLINKGLAALIENENKDISDLRNSLMGHDPAMVQRILYYVSNSQEEWMRILNGVYAIVDKLCARQLVKVGKKPKKKMGESAADYRARCGPKENKAAGGWVFPVVIGLDSITATSSEAEQGKIRDSGAPERGFSWEAQSLAKLARTLPGRLRSRPILFVGTNHLKPGTDENTGAPRDNVPGGKAMRFMDTNELKLVRYGRPWKGLHDGGVTIRIQMVKNSLAPSGEAISVDMCWQYTTDPETGLVVQQTAWDWDKATIDYLMAQKVKATLWAEINAIVDLHEASQNRIWSRALGIPEQKPVKRRIAGAMLEARRDLVAALYPVLHITVRAKYRPGEDYVDLLNRLGKMAEDERKPLEESPYTRRDLSFVDHAGEQLAATRAKTAKAPRKKAPAEVDDEEDDG